MRESLENLVNERKQQLAQEPNSPFDTSYSYSVVKVLYEKSEAAMQLRAGCNARLRRAINVIRLWAYDMAEVEFKNGMKLVVYLQPKVFGDPQEQWAAHQNMSCEFSTALKEERTEELRRLKPEVSPSDNST